MLAFFLISFLQSSALCCPNIMKICQRKCQKSIKMEVWGPLGQLLEAFGPQNGPKLKKPQKSKFEDPPPGTQFGNQNLRKKWLRYILVVFYVLFLSLVFCIDFKWFQGPKLMPFRGVRHAWSVVNNGRIEVFQFFRKSEFSMPPGTPPGSLFEAILAPGWGQVGSRVEFWRFGTSTSKNMKKRGRSSIREFWKWPSCSL